MIRISGLTKSYGNARILDIPDFRFEKDRIHTIVGANGSGKTTLLRIINKLETPTAGSVETGVLQREMVLCFQKPYLFKTTVRKNIGYGLTVRGIRNISEKVHSIAQRLGLIPIMDRDTHSLSGGELQKVSLARALILEPKLLLLDEPFANLDPQSLEQVIHAVTEMAGKGTTVIISTHILENSFRLSHTIVKLDNGNLYPYDTLNIFEGTLRQVDGTVILDISGKLSIVVATGKRGQVRAILSPVDVILSKDTIESSMRNTFKGTVTGIEHDNTIVKVTVDIGIPVRAHITPASCTSLGIEEGCDIFASFKAVSVQVY